MFEKQKALRNLSALLAGDRFEEFKDAYEYCDFDIDSYRPWFSGDNRDLLSQAMLLNKPQFAAFLMERISPEDIPGIEGEYDDRIQGGRFRESILYMAIDNDMEDIALQLIDNPGIDLDDGRKIERRHYSVVARSNQTVWEEVDSPFDLAGQKGNAKIIEALYNKKIRQLNAHAEHLTEGGVFFPQTRADSARKKAAEFQAARDALLKKPPAPRSDDTPKPGWN